MVRKALTKGVLSSKIMNLEDLSTEWRNFWRKMEHNVKFEKNYFDSLKSSRNIKKLENFVSYEHGSAFKSLGFFFLFLLSIFAWLDKTDIFFSGKEVDWWFSCMKMPVLWYAKWSGNWDGKYFYMSHSFKMLKMSLRDYG